jgi:hypothetical protein
VTRKFAKSIRQPADDYLPLDAAERAQQHLARSGTVIAPIPLTRVGEDPQHPETSPQMPAPGSGVVGTPDRRRSRGGGHGDGTRDPKPRRPTQ